jgi:hypothetical protein
MKGVNVSKIAASGSKINRIRGSGVSPDRRMGNLSSGARPACTGLRSLRADAYSRGLEQHSY